MLVTEVDQPGRPAPGRAPQTVSDQRVHNNLRVTNCPTGLGGLHQSQAGSLKDIQLLASRPGQRAGISIQYQPDLNPSIVQMARAAQPAATVAPRPGQNSDPAVRITKHLQHIARQVTAGVLHHLQDAEAKILHGDAVYLAHLFGRHGRHEHPILCPKRHTALRFIAHLVAD